MDNNLKPLKEPLKKTFNGGGVVVCYFIILKEF